MRLSLRRKTLVKRVCLAWQSRAGRSETDGDPLLRTRRNRDEATSKEAERTIDCGAIAARHVATVDPEFTSGNEIALQTIPLVVTATFGVGAVSAAAR